MKVKAFDCVETQHRGAERIREKTKGLTVREQVAFWKDRSAALRKRRSAAKKG
jgi:hypothetical protein